MNSNRNVLIIVIFLLLLRAGMAFGQAARRAVAIHNNRAGNHMLVNSPANGAAAAPPLISYNSPQHYTVNTVIATLSPANAGGAVPATVYGQVSTFAGSTTPGAVNGTGAQASFRSPVGMAMDGAGNIYVSDDNNSMIRKISPGGLVSTFAGSTTKGNTNGTGTAASFNAPFGVAVDGAGNVYVADEGNNLIRKINPAGVVTTFAGSGVVGSVNGTGTAAAFNHPYDVAVDGSGIVYVADGASNLVRKITPAGVVTTLAGSGSTGYADGNGAAASFNAPGGIAVDGAGNIYVGDSQNNLIREITPGGTVTTIAGSGVAGSADGTGNAASFSFPYGLTVDAIGNIYVADLGNNLIRKIAPGGIVTTIAGSGSFGHANGIGAAAAFDAPSDLSIDASGNLYLSDELNFEIRKIITTGFTIDKALPPGLIFDPTTGTISGKPTAASPAAIYTITAFNTGGSSSATVSITVNANSNNVIAAPNVTYQTPQTYYINTPISPLTPKNTGGAVPNNTYGQVSTYAGNGSAGRVNGASLASSFMGPAGVVFDRAGNLFVSESTNNDIREITAAGVVSTVAGNGVPGAINGAGSRATFSSPLQLAVDAAGNLYIADENNMLIRMITTGGTVSTFAGNYLQTSINGPALKASFNIPAGIVIDAAGNKYVTDRGDDEIRLINTAGQVSTLQTFNNGTAPAFNTGLYSLALDASRNLYIADDNQVKVLTASGTVNIIAGSGTAGFANGQGIAANFNGPGGIAVDGGGNIYIADTYNNRIRAISPGGFVTTLAGGAGAGSNDGLSASAGFNMPFGLTIDNTGNYLFVADEGNNRIRQVAITGYTIDKSLPTGLSFDPTTGIISGAPAVLSPPTIYTITAHNGGGNSTATVNIQVDEQTIIFGPLPVKTVCAIDFDPGAISAAPITYTSSNTTVATIVLGKIHITGPGTSDIAATDGTTSITQTLKVTAAVMPTITLSPVALDSCQGAVVTLTASITNGGSNPAYQWKVNGQNVGSNNPVFNSGNLNSNDKITCTLTSNATCAVTNTAISNTTTFIIDPPISTSVTIVSSAAGPICAGTPVTFTATAFTPDIHPDYQWQINGVNTGANNPTFTSTTLVNGDVVTCVLGSIGKCLINPLATSNAITTTLSPASGCIVTIPNTFTPNGDGINDLWDITALRSYPECTISIYSRYGSLVYSSIGYPKPWNGTFNGKALPVGTYYYIIDLKNGKRPFSGSVTIVR